MLTHIVANDACLGWLLTRFWNRDTILNTNVMLNLKYISLDVKGYSIAAGHKSEEQCVDCRSSGISVPACYRLIAKLAVTAAHPTFNRAFNSDDEANRQIGRGEGLACLLLEGLS